jgi:hypothetical protein
LLDVALEAKAKGVVLHLNNLENLSERDVTNAADILRSLRDTVLLQPGLHTLLVGTTEAVTAATTSHAQLRSVFTVTALEPLPLSDVQELLTARYRHLRLRPNARVTPPVTEEAVAALYPLFRGDLRGLFKALEEGVNLLIGVTSTKPGSSLHVDELSPGLERRYQALLAATLSPTRAEQVEVWVTELGVDATPAQDELKKVWKVSQSGVSQALKDLIQCGSALALPKTGPGVVRYALSGASRLAFGATSTKPRRT